MLNWLNAREAVDVGVSLADEFAPLAPSGQRPRQKPSARREPDAALKALLRRAEQDSRARRLNFYQRARFANSFKWRLLESGVPDAMAAEVTRRLVVHLTMRSGGPTPEAPVDPHATSKARHLFTHGNQCIADRQYIDAIGFYEACIAKNPRHAEAHNNLGAALSELGRHREAETRFREALEIAPAYADAHANLGVLLHEKGLLMEAADSLRRALKLKPGFVDARAMLAATLMLLGRLKDARAQFRKALKIDSAHPYSLLGMARLARMEGRFQDAESLIRRVLSSRPDLACAWAALAGLRRMERTDAPWLERAEALAAGHLPPNHESDLRFAIGKFHDDTGDYRRAFESFRRGNEILKAFAEPYRRDARDGFVAAIEGAYPAPLAAAPPGARETPAVLVVGMMRSGTSLVEQILASHPAVHGAGELDYWNELVHARPELAMSDPPHAALGRELADGYERVLVAHGGTASRIIDKAVANADYVGLIYSVLPRIRIVYLRRDPIDVCLSAYFQQLSPAINYSMDLDDLAHFYRSHHRLMSHWRRILPPGAMLEVPYAELIADQVGWTRRLLEFIDLDWDSRCLDFHATARPVATASNWQVRQKLYASSVGRWRNYAKFIGPLADLHELESRG